MANELQDRRAFTRLFERFSREWVYTLIAALCLISAIFARVDANDADERAKKAIDAANAANIRSEMQTQRLDDLKAQNDILLIRTSKMDAYLKAKGVNLEEIYND